jgi:integrase
MAKARRSYGTGSLYVHTGKTGGKSWYGRWYSGGKRARRVIGPKREPGSPDGLTRAEAEAELRRLMHDARAAQDRASLTVAVVSERLLHHLETVGRKPTTLATYRSAFETHLLPAFGALSLREVDEEHVENLMAAMQESGKAAKTRANALVLLHQLFHFAERNGWCTDNPCARVDRPQVEPTLDIRFLNEEEFKALLEAVDVAHEPLGHVDRAMFLTAAMTGLRQGELLALRWRDVDWRAERIRVRRNYVRGHWGTPKSRRGLRSVPLGTRVARELEQLRQRSVHDADEDLVFGHPCTGEVLDHSQLTRRFKSALRAAGLREFRFNDLRHTFGTRMAGEGAPMRDLQEWMGHRSISTTEIYADYEPQKGGSGTVDEAFS